MAYRASLSMAFTRADSAVFQAHPGTNHTKLHFPCKGHKGHRAVLARSRASPTHEWAAAHRIGQGAGWIMGASRMAALMIGLGIGALLPISPAGAVPVVGTFTAFVTFVQ